MEHAEYVRNVIDQGQGDWFTSGYGDGCDLHDSCFTCPLPVCRYEMPQGRARALLQAQALARLLIAGRTKVQAAVELGVTRRTVHRLLRMRMTDTERAWLSEVQDANG